MTAVAKLDLPPSEALILLDYEDADKYLDALRATKERNELRNQLIIAEAVRRGTSANRDQNGARRYSSWIAETVRKINGEREERGLTVFERLRLERPEQVDKRSLFERIVISEE